MDDLQLLKDKKYPPGTTVEIDGKRFVRCVLDRCRLIYRGTEELSFEGCTFIDPDWSFEGAAENVLAFMGDMYEGLGDKGQLVESLFAAVRKNEIRDANIPILSEYEISRQRMTG